MSEKKPVLEFILVVQDHNTKEFDEEKPDEFTVSLEAPEKSFKVGLEDAKAKVKIKAFDDIVKHNLPLGGVFTCKIFSRAVSLSEVKKPTTATTLPESKGDKGEL